MSTALLRRAGCMWLCALLSALCLALPASAQTADAAKGPPAGFVAPADPKPGENNAQREKTQPGNNAPFWRAVRESGYQQGTTSLPGAETGTLIQPFMQYPGSRLTTAGEAWRQVRNNWILPYGGALLVIVGVAIALFYWRVGPMGGHEPNTGRVIERFTFFERAAHWTNAIAFVTLAISGIVMAFGKFFLLPLIGGLLFGWLTYALKTLHNVVGPLFAVSLLIVVLTFVKDQVIRSYDWAWLRKGGGLLGGTEPASHRFNAGEKVLFWIGMLGLGVVVVASGLVLDQLVPGWGITRGEMQIAHMVHAIAAVGMMIFLAGHIYMGTLGMKGAYQGMRTGWVDEGWAKEHHALWYEDVRAGRIPAQRSATPTPAGGTPATPSTGARA